MFYICRSTVRHCPVPCTCPSPPYPGHPVDGHRGSRLPRDQPNTSGTAHRTFPAAEFPECCYSGGRSRSAPTSYLFTGKFRKSNVFHCLLFNKTRTSCLVSVDLDRKKKLSQTIDTRFNFLFLNHNKLNQIF